MFTAQHIKDLMNAQPFRPFRICMSDGHTYDVTNHDSAMVARHAIHVGVHPDPNGFAERLVSCSILHITRIEELQPA